ncbi:MAG: hypothetical protein Q9227_008419 [Pyrenula ochraceoflavens]
MADARQSTSYWNGYTERVRFQAANRILARKDSELAWRRLYRRRFCDADLEVDDIYAWTVAIENTLIFLSSKLGISQRMALVDDSRPSIHRPLRDNINVVMTVYKGTMLRLRFIEAELNQLAMDELRDFWKSVNGQTITNLENGSRSIHQYTETLVQRFSSAYRMLSALGPIGTRDREILEIYRLSISNAAYHIATDNLPLVAAVRTWKETWNNTNRKEECKDKPTAVEKQIAVSGKGKGRAMDVENDEVSAATGSQHSGLKASSDPDDTTEEWLEDTDEPVSAFRRSESRKRDSEEPSDVGPSTSKVTRVYNADEDLPSSPLSYEYETGTSPPSSPRLHKVELSATPPWKKSLRDDCPRDGASSHPTSPNELHDAGGHEQEAQRTAATMAATALFDQEESDADPLRDQYSPIDDVYDSPSDSEETPSVFQW